jgi:hypothetical protein
MRPLKTVIFPALVCAYVRCVVLCVRCTPELQTRPEDASAAWKPWARVLIFTLVPVQRLHRPVSRDVPKSVLAPHAYCHSVRMALQRLNGLR